MHRLAVLAVLSVVISAVYAGVVVNPTSGYSRWPTNIVPVKTNLISNAYPEYPVLTAAMNQISLDLGYCINFTIYNTATNVNQANIVLQNKFSNTATPSDMCWTYPGYTAAGGINGQVMIVFGSTSGNTVGGCLDNQRDAMRILANSLGLRNEYMRADRDAYMTFPSTIDRNSLVAPILQKYNIFAATNQYNSSVATPYTAFDYNSITMVSGTRFAGTSTPVFTTPSGTTVGQLSRLSLGDCNSLKLMYGCPPSGYGPTPSCIDPYSSSTGVTLSPSPAVITKTIQCSTTTTTTTSSTNVPIATFLVNGLNCDANNQNAYTLAVTPLVSGLGAKLVKYLLPLTVTAATGVLTEFTGTAGTTCQYGLVFTYNLVPTQGQSNTQLTVNFQQNTATQTGVTVASVSVTLNLNCAPQFQSITAFQVGAAAVLANPVTKTLGGTAPNVIQVVPTPVATSAATFSLAAASLPSYFVQYVAEFGITGALGSGTSQAPITKAFVNCQGASNAFLPAGVTVIGSLSATDPEGGSVSYYIWSGISAAAAAKDGESWKITDDGIITLSAVANAVGTATAGTSLPPDTNAAAVTTAYTETAPRDVFIAAVDSQGGQSVLQARFYLGCGTTV